MKNFFLNSFLSVFLFTSISYSQERTLTGVVTTLENIVVVGAEVKVLSSKATVLTDSLGNYKVNCLLKDKIRISANGFFTEKIKINEETKEASINLKFKPKEESIDVALGYGHINEKDKTYAITTIKNNDKFGFSRFTNMHDLILNSSSSITLINGDFIIRGASSLQGSSAALIVIDGIDVNKSQLSSLSPYDVKSIDILKGSSASIYGSRGANGVVLITTKRGGD
jgi:TonB-dependent SusC/RagA subfamily outer membrane receptor